MGNLITNNP